MVEIDIQKQEVLEAEEFNGHKMLSIGNTKMSLNKALKVLAHADEIKTVAKDMLSEAKADKTKNTDKKSVSFRF